MGASDNEKGRRGPRRLEQGARIDSRGVYYSLATTMCDITAKNFRRRHYGLLTNRLRSMR